MKNNDETILEILQGHKTSKWPNANVAKIFIASTRTGKKQTILYVIKQGNFSCLYNRYINESN